MKSNIINNLDYKNLVLTILVTLLVFTFSLKINKHLKMFFLLISLFICIYDLRYLIPFLVTFLIVNLNKKDKVEHFSSRDVFHSYLRNIENYEISKNKKDRFRKEIKNLPFFSDTDTETDLIDGLFNRIITLKTTNTEIRTFGNTSHANKPTIFNRIINRINPTPQLLFDILLLGENDALNINRIGILDSLDRAENSILKKMGLLFSLSSDNSFNNFMYKISKQIGLSEIYNNNLSPTKPITTRQVSAEVINKNFEYSQNLFNEKRKSLLQAILFIFKQNMTSDMSINDLITEKDEVKSLFDYDFSVEKYLEDDSEEKITNLVFSNLADIVNFDFNVFRPEFIITDYGDRTSLENKLSHFYNKNQSVTLKRILMGNFRKIKKDIDNTPDRTPVDKANAYINRYKRDITNVIEDMSLLDSTLRPIRDNELKNTEKLKILSNLYSFIFFTNLSNFSTPFNKYIQIDDIHENLRNDFVSKKENLEEKVDNPIIPLNDTDIFYNQIFFYIKISNNNYDFFVPDIFEEVIVPSFEVPSESLEENPSWYSDSELKRFFDVNEMNDKNENELEKYYRAMDFNNPNLHEISRQASIQNSNKKNEEISFNKVVDNFSDNTYGIIDDFKELITETMESESFEFKKFINSFIGILTKKDRELSIGFIFICLGLLLYFMEDTTHKNEINLIEYLSQIKI
jgi:hypothetical protein